MDIITGVVIGACIAIAAYKYGEHVAAAKLQNCTCGGDEIAPEEIAPEEEFDDTPEHVRAFRARVDAAEAARRHVAFEEAGD